MFYIVCGDKVPSSTSSAYSFLETFHPEGCVSLAVVRVVGWQVELLCLHIFKGAL